MTRSTAPGRGVYKNPGRGSARGFTILEIMAALMIAALLAAAALPTMNLRGRDRLAQQFAQHVALAYREARTRAIGRGTSHVVRFTVAPNPQGRVQMFEAVQAVGASTNVGNCANSPRVGVDSCGSVNWGVDAQSRQVSDLVNPQGGPNAEVFAKFLFNGSEQAAVDVCFSPGGRSYIRTALTGSFSTFTGVHRVRVRRMKSDGSVGLDLLARDVLLLPNGSTRVESAVLGSL